MERIYSSNNSSTLVSSQQLLQMLVMLMKRKTVKFPFKVSSILSGRVISGVTTAHSPPHLALRVSNGPFSRRFNLSVKPSLSFSLTSGQITPIMNQLAMEAMETIVWSSKYMIAPFTQSAKTTQNWQLLLVQPSH